MSHLPSVSTSLGAAAFAAPSTTSSASNAVSTVAVGALESFSQVSGFKRPRRQLDSSSPVNESSSSSSSGTTSPDSSHKRIRFFPKVKAHIYQGSSRCFTTIDPSTKEAIEYKGKTNLELELNEADRAFRWDRGSMEYMPRSTQDTCKIVWPSLMKESVVEKVEVSSASYWETSLEYRNIFGASALFETLISLLQADPETVIGYEAVHFALLNEFTISLVKSDPRLNEDFVHALLTCVEQKDASSEEPMTFIGLIEETLARLHKKTLIKESISKELFWDLVSYDKTPRATPICVHRAQETASLSRGFKDWGEGEEKQITLLNYNADDFQYLISLGVLVKERPAIYNFFKIWRQFKTESAAPSSSSGKPTVGEK